jgi:hypothetical protein
MRRLRYSDTLIMIPTACEQTLEHAMDLVQFQTLGMIIGTDCRIKGSHVIRVHFI